MKTFQCTHCASLVFFDNSVCMQCGHALGFDPNTLGMLAIAPAQDSGAPASDAGTPPLWQLVPQPGEIIPATRYRQCRNQIDHQACNFLLDAGDPEAYCVSCRQTRTIPNLSVPGNLQHWTTIENAKRRLYYTLAKLGLEGRPVTPVYEFLEDVPGEDPVMTGHANGLITINIAEADDAERTRRRIALHEPYRTLLGHLRHEVGHFYWDQFFQNNEAELAAFRQMFGDEREDYGQALERHYQNPKPDWQTAYVSSYATSHPWEDWAETWAHYLHLIDLQETAAGYRMGFVLHGAQGQTQEQAIDPFDFIAQGPQAGMPQDITLLLNQSMGVSLVLNSLNRSLGQNDAYPFALSTPVLQKLEFVHNVVRRYVHGAH
ncbi:hypothetical protein D8I35_06645 [Corticibacter populi]|uniref:Zinc-ribbon domain-containing protein n=1 Tax=Corticibacter populi TaxID=1550736 RepID=A0A3M6R1T5_9BURK|nr:putative zinc-binding peptidase [Corticibacter populi]RMX08722.1 hypothetical protein D8I35_06645 [Corticibacter populi]RZS36072.1 hypothetical protein EV687_1161 [Corticibacter populi]